MKLDKQKKKKKKVLQKSLEIAFRIPEGATKGNKTFKTLNFLKLPMTKKKKFFNLVYKDASKIFRLHFFDSSFSNTIHNLWLYKLKKKNASIYTVSPTIYKFKLIGFTAKCNVRTSPGNICVTLITRYSVPNLHLDIVVVQNKTKQNKTCSAKKQKSLAEV